MELIILLICGGLAIITSLLVIFARNTVHSALWMVASFFFMAVLYLLLHAEFIAILQIIVYAGAIKGPVTDQLMAKFGHVAVLSNFLFSDYVLPFELASILLTAGVVGAVVLAKQKSE